MPPRQLEAGAEWEGCFATYFDFTDIVPAKYKSPDGNRFYVNSTDIRLTQGSHHLAMIDTAVPIEELSDASFGTWSCTGGSAAGNGCDPADSKSCGSGGHCTSMPQALTGCLGYGPFSANVNPAGFGLGTALQARERVAPIAGVYRAVPIKAVVFWDYHGFNLSDAERTMEGRMNLTFADDRQKLEQRLTVYGSLDGENVVPPFRKQELCDLWVAPQGAEILRMTSHTHRRGQRFRVFDPAGMQIYESLDYSDPAYVTFTPPLKTDAAAEEQRTFKFCSVFNNGLKPDGTPDMKMLTQVSLTPEFETFRPTAEACSTGMVGAACLPLFDDTQCDSSAGANDGKCDAASIHFGASTESEMFMMFPDLVMPEGTTESSDIFQSVAIATPLPNVDVQ